MAIFNVPRFSVRDRVQLTLAGAVLLVVTVGLLLHESLREMDLRKTRDAAALVVAKSLASPIDADANFSPDQLKRTCERILKNHFVAAVGLFDKSGTALVKASKSAAMNKILISPGPPRLKSITVSTVESAPTDDPNRAESVSLNLGRVDVPLKVWFDENRPARMTILLDLQRVLPDPRSYLWSFNVPVVTLAFGVLCIGLWWLERRVLEPMWSLATAAGSEHPECDALNHRRDEIGQVARGLSGLRAELAEWRRRAEHTERRMHSTVAERTREITEELKKYRREVWVDTLTGVKNRRLFEEKFAPIFAAQQASGGDLALVMVDLDNLKTVNDTLGHATGDQILTFAGELLRSCLRNDDIAIRYGGDEFVLLLPGVSAEDAHRLSFRILTLFSQRAKMIAPTTPAPSMTVGIASIRRHKPRSAADLLHMADQAMYRAKQTGKRMAYIFGGGNTAAAG
jgi:diguanylate cyclase (GGDEF)-like protein